MSRLGELRQVEWESLADWYVGSDDVLQCGVETPDECEACQ